LLALSEELERERKQLKDDEESLMNQMRDMEVTMAKERAELARHRTEMQRLHTEFRHEMELASRDASLRERLAPLQRKHQEMINRKGGAPSATATTPDAVALLKACLGGSAALNDAAQQHTVFFIAVTWSNAKAWALRALRSEAAARYPDVLGPVGGLRQLLHKVLAQVGDLAHAGHVDL